MGFRGPVGGGAAEAWIRLEERRAAEAREEEDNRLAQDAAHAAREVASAARAALVQLAGEQGLSAERAALEAAEQALRGLDDDLREAQRDDQPIRDGMARWQESLAELAAAREVLADETARAGEAERQANASRSQYEALRDSVGDSVDQLQQRISGLRRARGVHEAEQGQAEARVAELLRAGGEADQAARDVEQRLAEHLAHRSQVLATLVAIASVPGLVDAAQIDPADSEAIRSLAGHPVQEQIGRAVLGAVDTLAVLSQEDEIAARNSVWRAHAEATSGPAADHQLTILEFGELLAVSGRDEAGEAPVVTLATRVRAAVDRDRELLTDREKQQFEQHVLGELGDAIRACRRDAEELVRAMNTQLGTVTTSQGIRVRLDWKLRDDVPAEARAAVGLLVQPVGALIPEERAQLRDALHRLIDASRIEHPELSYSEHLAAALDYRTWSAFTIRYTRPETPDHWERLHRRSALSQGEQKVLCYLPLFAAAAAHFTSLAGAAPHAPRLVLLDDAFPKIDVRTHPLLFGLLVQLDLDFVITSERLWGDHATVPSLAIYEALRDPNQRGIAQYEYRWDGRVLQGIG